MPDVEELPQRTLPVYGHAGRGGVEEQPGGPDSTSRWRSSYDVREKVWNPPMPLLFQRDIGTEHRALTPTALRKFLINALAATGLTDAGGEPLVFSPHDFRRIFVTDATTSSGESSAATATASLDAPGALTPAAIHSRNSPS
ncbi:hypothetical protein [Streptomyces chartreusis]|uniref:hypothetical protein n=1 Tax=Streptomyces chartreusis TaxID=1969 RepID=UPI002E800C36|nr:hypothetical protein [Streptomyces chartreusis]WUB18348.1 hypothetical protein OG997_17180 [Streptomyces chartreusis]